jgi:hypothetical protein
MTITLEQLAQEDLIRSQTRAQAKRIRKQRKGY